jgi:hypothetical protein
MKDIHVTKVTDTTCKVVMATKKARKALFKSTDPSVEQIPPDQIILSDQLYKILAWAVTHRLTMDNGVPIIIPSRETVKS